MPTLPILRDLGTTPSRSTEAEAPSPPKKFFPSIHGIDVAKLPALDIYDVGDDVILIIKGHVDGKHLREEGKNETAVYDIELREAAVMDVGKFKKLRESGVSKTAMERSEKQE